MRRARQHDLRRRLWPIPGGGGEAYLGWIGQKERSSSRKWWGGHRTRESTRFGLDRHPSLPEAPGVPGAPEARSAGQDAARGQPCAVFRAYGHAHFALTQDQSVRKSGSPLASTASSALHTLMHEILSFTQLSMQVRTETQMGSLLQSRSSAQQFCFAQLPQAVPRSAMSPQVAPASAVGLQESAQRDCMHAANPW